MNFVSKTIRGGFPQYLSKTCRRNQLRTEDHTTSIYYGQSLSGYRIVDTAIKEFDYPKGNDNVYASYAGTGGIPLGSLWKRLLFAWNKGDINILMTSYLTPESRIQIHRDVRERVSEVAPFLRLDSDPYPVLSEASSTGFRTPIRVRAIFLIQTRNRPNLSSAPIKPIRRSGRMVSARGLPILRGRMSHHKLLLRASTM